MACTLRVVFATPGFGSGSETINYSVPDGSYRSAYKVVTGGPPGNTYQVRSDGISGTLTLGTYTPGSINVSITSSSVSCPAGTGYDCINGACIKQNIYNSPGLYASLSACQAACGIGCDGKCISNSEWAQLENLASQLKNRNCS